jgi:photosystem II stability/assembly factor-like uncharacterized protein
VRQWEIFLFISPCLSLLASPSLRLFVSSSLLFLCGCLPVSAQKQGSLGWVWQNPLPQGNSLYSIHFAKDKENGFAVGAENTILRTENGGFRWQKQSSPNAAVTLSGVFVKDKKNAVVVGSRGSIYTTDDGGKEWRRNEIEIKDHLYGVALAGENFETGWAVGTYGRILKTIDGGENWGNQTSGTTEQLLKVAAFDAQKSSSSARTARFYQQKRRRNLEINKPCDNFLMAGAAYQTAEKIVAVGYGGCVARSIDGGETWEKIKVFSRTDFLSVYFTDEKTGFMTDANGMIWLTGDGGDIWLPFSIARIRNSSPFISPTRYRLGGWRKRSDNPLGRRRLQLAAFERRRTRRCQRYDFFR